MLILVFARNFVALSQAPAPASVLVQMVLKLVLVVA